MLGGKVPALAQRPHHEASRVAHRTMSRDRHRPLDVLGGVPLGQLCGDIRAIPPLP